MIYYGMDPVLIAAAIIPAIVLLVQVNKADKLEHEPSNLLASLVFLGIISTSIAMLLEQIGQAIISPVQNGNSILYGILMYYIVVGCSEEGAKYILLKRKTWNHPAFNCSFDGVVYSVFVSLGFALWENIGYVGMYGFEVALTRAITAIPGHASFGVFMGVFYGLAKKYEANGMPKRSKSFRNMAYIIPVLLHGSYDFLATLDFALSNMIFIAFIGVLFLFAFITVKKMSKDDEFFKTEDTYFIPFHWQ